MAKTTLLSQGVQFWNPHEVRNTALLIMTLGVMQLPYIKTNASIILTLNFLSSLGDKG